MKNSLTMRPKISFAVAALLWCASAALAQSGATRPRRVNPVQPVPTPDTSATRAGSTASAPTAARTTPAAANSARAGTTQHAYALLQQGQYEAALREAKQIAAADAKNSEAWKIAGFAETNLKRYGEAAEDLQRALDLQRAAGEDDLPTLKALIQAYVLTEKYDRALPLLVAATSRPNTPADAALLYSRGLAEVKLNKVADAERSFAAAVKADPKHAYSLYYLGYLAYNRREWDAAINSLNRATASDPRLSNAWALLTSAYMNRAQAATGPKADADYLAAVRAAESLTRARDDEQSAALLGQALVFSKQYVRAATVLERAAANEGAQGSTLYLLGFAHVRAKNYPKAVAALERAAAKTPDNAEVFRELGFAYEASKQYAKALAAYERGAQLAPADAYFKESADRIRPFAQQP
jgi:tetratricopeptide (TPR) repeat protein